MSPKFISDADMSALEASQPKKVISDDEMAQMESSQAPKPQSADLATQGAAALEGFGQAATAGYLPQIGAAVGALIPNPARTVNEKLKAQGFKIQEAPDNYVTRRDELIRRGESLQKQAPVASALGTGAGVIASIPVMGGAGKAAIMAGKAVPGIAGGARLAEAGLQAKDLGLLGRTAQAASAAAIQAAVMNPGDVEGRIQPLQLEQRGEQAKLGGLIGGAAPAAGSILGAVSKAIGSIPERLQTMGQTRAAAALGMNKGQAKKFIQQDPTGMEGFKIKEIGDFAIKKGIVKPGAEVLDIAEKSAAIKKDIGQKIGDAYDKADGLLSFKSTADLDKFRKQIGPDKWKQLSATEFDKQKMADAFKGAVEKEFTGSAGGSQAIRAATAQLDDFLAIPKDKLSIRDLQKFKSELDDIIFAHDRTPGNLPSNSASLKTFRDFLKGAVDKRIGAIDSALGDKIGANLKVLNKEYGLASQANKISRDRMAGELGNNWLSLTDKIALFGGAGAGVASADSPEEMLKRGLIGAGMGLGSKGVRTYGRPIMAAGALKAGELAAKIPPNLPSVMSKGAGLIKGAPAQSGAAAVRAIMGPKNEKRSSK